MAKNALRLLPGGIVEITLTKGKVALIDVADLPLVAHYSWHTGIKNGHFYPRAYVPGSGKGSSPISMHHVLCGRQRIDHKNGDGLDNRRANLRPATAAQNNRNRSRSATRALYKGVYASGKSGWRARIRLNGRVHNLGTFRTPEEAARAYDDAALRLHGAFANLNFPTVQ